MVEEPLTQAKGKKIGILGGTFNPPHLAHLMIAEQVASQLGLDKILFVPDYLPPHVDKKEAIAAEHRVEMVRLAIQGNPNFDLDLIEINRRGDQLFLRYGQGIKRNAPRKRLLLYYRW